MEILLIITGLVVLPVIPGMLYLVYRGIVFTKSEFEHSGYFQVLSDEHKNQLRESFEKLKRRNWIHFLIVSGVASVYFLSSTFYISTLDKSEDYQQVTPIIFSGMVFLAAIYILSIFEVNGNGFEITLWSLFFNDIGIDTSGLVEKSPLKWEFWKPRRFAILRNSFIKYYYPETSFLDRYRHIKEVIQEETSAIDRFDTISVTKNLVNDLRILGEWPFDRKGLPLTMGGLIVMGITLVFVVFRINYLSELYIILLGTLIVIGLMIALAGIYTSKTLTIEKIRFILGRRDILTVGKSNSDLFDELCKILDREYPVINLE